MRTLSTQSLYATWSAAAKPSPRTAMLRFVPGGPALRRTVMLSAMGASVGGFRAHGALVPFLEVSARGVIRGHLAFLISPTVLDRQRRDAAPRVTRVESWDVV